MPGSAGQNNAVEPTHAHRRPRHTANSFGNQGLSDLAVRSHRGGKSRKAGAGGKEREMRPKIKQLHQLTGRALLPVVHSLDHVPVTIRDHPPLEL